MSGAGICIKSDALKTAKRITQKENEGLRDITPTPPTPNRFTAAIEALRQASTSASSLTKADVLDDNLDTILAALVIASRLEGGPQWKVAATAPKDGTEFDVWKKLSGGSGFRFTGVIWRTPDDDENPWGDDRKHAFRDRDGYKVSFSHWMPLPAPPSDEAKTEGV